MKRSIVWFRKDLRIHDNEALHDAIKENDEIIPVYIFDERVFKAETKFGFPKTAQYRCQFIIDSVKDLRENLKSYSSELIVRKGKPEEIIPRIARRFKSSYVYCNRERTQEEFDVQDALEHNLWHIGQEIRYYRGKMLYYTADLPFPISHCPDSFTQFRKELEKFIPIREPLETDFVKIISPLNVLEEGTIPEPMDYGWKTDDYNNSGIQGGESAALKELKYYLWETNLIKEYKDTRKLLGGRDYSSKLSAYLSQGCLSPKLLYAEVKKYVEQNTGNKSTSIFIMELMWRDFHRFMAKKHGNQIFKLEGIRNGLKPKFIDKPELFDKWKNAKTGIPFIDANMRELNSTGFMSNSGRLSVASFLINDLKLNWIQGAEYFESLLVDYDPCSNYGNWNLAAGVGLDYKDDHYLNIPNQAKRLDPKAEYIKHWIPELTEANLEDIFNPFINGEPKLHINTNYVPPCLHFKTWLVS